MSRGVSTKLDQTDQPNRRRAHPPMTSAIATKMPLKLHAIHAGTPVTATSSTASLVVLSDQNDLLFVVKWW
jgi:hypothetical protein